MPLIYWISAGSPILPLVFGIAAIKKLNGAGLIMLMFVITALFFEIASSYSASQGIQNKFLLPLFSFTEFLFLGLFFVFLTKGLSRKIILITGTALLLVVIVPDMVKTLALNEFNTFSRSASGITLIFYSLVYFYYLVKEPVVEKSWYYPEFWFVSGIMFYFMGNFMIFTLGESLLTFDDFRYFDQAWTIHGILNIIQKILFAVGFYWYLK